MKRLLFIALIVLAAASAQAVDKYWVGIGTDNEASGSNGLPIFLEQIDQNGNVLKAPVAIIPDSQLPPGHANDERTVALSYNAAGKLLVYVGQDSVHDVWRFILDPNTLQVLSRKQILTNIEYPDYFQATQPQIRFLATDKPGGVFKGIPMDPSSGLPSGKQWRLIPRYEDSNYHDSSIAADGGMAVRIMGANSDEIVAQPLDASGKPAGLPSIAARFHSEDLDVTNLLPNGRRFIVFTESVAPSNRYLQVIDGRTGAKFGAPILLAHLSQGEANQSMAVDPLGRFVIFNVAGEQAGCGSGNANDPLFFLPLNQNTGQPAGPEKQITPCDMYDSVGGSITSGQFGIDIIRIP